MRTSDANILIIPSLGNAGPDHWLTRWESRLKTARRIEQDNWNKAAKNEWTDRISQGIAQCERPAVLLAHGLGVIALAHAAPAQAPGKVAGAFLVSPTTETAMQELPGIDEAFMPIPMGILPFPSLLIASRTDARNPFSRMEHLAANWGALLVDAGDAGHIDAESGHGPWPEGLMRLANFLGKL